MRDYFMVSKLNQSPMVKLEGETTEASIIGEYRHGSRFELAIGARTAKGRYDYRKYHASASKV
ncbi:hypothetical protein YC2023_033726 [Brassica napus]